MLTPVFLDKLSTFSMCSHLLPYSLPGEPLPTPLTIKTAHSMFSKRLVLVGSVMWTPTHGLQQVQVGSQNSSVAIQVSQRVFQETRNGSLLGGSFLSENENGALMRGSPILPPVPRVPHLNSVSAFVYSAINSSLFRKQTTSRNIRQITIE